MTYKLRNFLTSLLLPWLLTLSVGVYAQQAPSDEEIKALEQQIEKKEAEQAQAKKTAETEAKRKAEEEAKRKAEEELLHAVEETKKPKLENQHATEEEVRRQAEEADKQRKEEDAKLKAEAEKKEMYLLLISEAEQAVTNKDKDLALNKYTEALKLYPNDPAASAGMKEADKMKDKVCYEILGNWDALGLGTYKFREDGTYVSRALILTIEGTWECSDPKNRQFKIKSGLVSGILKLRIDGSCLEDNLGVCYRRATDEIEYDQKNQSQNPLGH